MIDQKGCNPSPQEMKEKTFRVIKNLAILKMAGMMEALDSTMKFLSHDLIASFTQEGQNPDKQLSEEFKKELKETKDDLNKQMEDQKETILSFLQPEMCEECKNIIVKNKTSLPLLCEELDESALSTYLIALQSEQPDVMKLWDALIKWELKCNEIEEKK